MPRTRKKTTTPANLLMKFRAIAAYINTSAVVAFPFQKLDSRTYNELRWAE